MPGRPSDAACLTARAGPELPRKTRPYPPFSRRFSLFSVRRRAVYWVKTRETGFIVSSHSPARFLESPVPRDILLTPLATRLHHWRRLPRQRSSVNARRAAQWVCRSLLVISLTRIDHRRGRRRPERHRHLFAGRGPIRLFDRLGHAVHLADGGDPGVDQRRVSAGHRQGHRGHRKEHYPRPLLYDQFFAIIGLINLAPIWARWPMRWRFTVGGSGGALCHPFAAFCTNFENFSKYNSYAQNLKMVIGAVRLPRGARRQAGRSRPRYRSSRRLPAWP